MGMKDKFICKNVYPIRYCYLNSWNIIIFYVQEHCSGINGINPYIEDPCINNSCSYRKYDVGGYHNFGVCDWVYHRFDDYISTWVCDLDSGCI